jgi:nicotinate-nucleotide adenylyltransferase
MVTTGPSGPASEFLFASSSIKYKISGTEHKVIFGHGSHVSVGILGGTFNPPHLGHLRLAEEVASLHRLDRVVLIPALIPPHKDSEDIASASDRLEMTRLACRDNPRLEVSDLEIQAQGPSYTVRTLETWAQRHASRPYFIMGTDSLGEITSWKDYERLFSLSHFIVVTRPGTPFDDAWSRIPQAVHARFSVRGDRLVHADDNLEIVKSQVKGLDISSTSIRSLARAGQSIRYLVRETVRSYITRHHLYRC